jgi:hypothetical protein
MAAVVKPLAFAWVSAALLLAACAGYAPVNVQPGQSADEVTRSMGQPTGRYALPQGGQRLEYARGPYGKHTWMIDVDPSGRVRSVEQVLTEANFATVKPGETTQDVLLKLGRPSDRRGAFRNTELWSYRYDATFCQWFVVTMNPDGRVRDTGYVPDPLCDADDDGARSGVSVLLRPR